MNALTILGTVGAIFLGSNLDNLVLLTTLFGDHDSRPLSVVHAQLSAAVLSLSVALLLGLGLSGLCPASGVCSGVILIVIGGAKLVDFDSVPSLKCGVWIPVMVGNIDNCVSYAAMFTDLGSYNTPLAGLAILALTAIMLSSAFMLSRLVNVSRLQNLNYAPLLLVGIGIYKIVN